MIRRIEREILKIVADRSNPQIIIEIPGCPCIFHQPKRPDSLRRNPDCKKETN